MEPDCDSEKLKSKVVAKAMGPTQAPLGEGVDARFRTKPALKTIK